VHLSLTDSFAAVTAVGTITGLFTALVPVRKHFQLEKAQTQRIEDALMGVPATPSLPARPSLFEAVSSLANDLNEIKDLTKQLRPNGGSSLADEIRRSAHKLDRLQEQISVQESRFIAHLEVHANGQITPTSPTPENRPNPQRNRRSPRSKQTTEGE
jgi:hypothetical protein